MPLSEDLDTLMGLITTRAAALAPAANPKDLVILSKAAEAMRGTVALQAVIDASDAGISALTGGQASALAALAAALAAAETDIDGAQDAAIAAINDVATTQLAIMLAALNTSGNYRVGDVWQAIIPNAAALPANVWVLDGSVKLAADCPALIAAWGLGGTVCPFIVNYNATNPYTLSVAVTGPNIQLPNLIGGFQRGRGLTDVGLYQLDDNKAHTHGGLTGSEFLVKGASGAEGGLTAGAVHSPIQLKATTASDGSEARPVNYAGLWFTRFA